MPYEGAKTDRNFGLQVTADTSGERTFNFLNVVDGPKNPPISSRTVKLPPLKPGETIGLPATGTVNYVQDVPAMVIEPPARGAEAREFRTEMDLTEDQVDQIANGGMTIGWKGQYNNDWKADYGYFFSDSGKFLVNGVVNPWPSENADCTPITIKWADQLDTEKYEASVIKPGETVKVGTVSADKDSLERLRFIAKDPNGNEVPGEITREGNDIYWTMADYIEGQPAYTKTDELTFEMIALPRDLAGLKKAAEDNGSLPDTVYDSSLAPERYRSPETIATKTFDIDDAKNHDPNYDSRQQSITSGVANKAPTEERQTRTFTNVADSNGDTLTDLVNKYNAEIELDDTNVYEGWDAYFRDPENGDYTVVVESPAGTDARPGSFAQPIVKVTYSNGTQDIIPLLVIVDPNNTQTTDVVYPPATIRGLIGEEMTSAAPTLKRVIGKNQKPVTPASYTVDPATVPAGWTIEVAEDGTVTATSPAGAKAGDMARPKITATYPDGTIDEREVTFLVGDDASLNNPSYPVEVTKPGAPVTHRIQNAPEGVTFTLDNDEVDGWTYSIDPNTGVVTVTPPAGAKGGDKRTNTVTVTYPDGTTDTVPVDTVVAHSFNYEAEPHYPQETAYPGEQITSPLSVDKPDEVGYAAENPFAIVPGEGFTATGENNEFGNPIYTVNTPNGDWTVSLDNDGNVISQIPETAKKGDSVSVPVKVTYEDNSTDETTAVITVEDNPERQVPFGVEYKYDPALPAGTYEVETKGVAGVEKQQRDGSWKRTKEPENEVVRVGTKQATADLSWTEPIPYSTTTRANPKLAPGETKVLQEGVNGERTHTAKVTSEGDQLDVTQTETTKDPVEEIIEYGPRLDDQELTTETTRKIPFDTQIIPDDTLAAGTQVVDKQGVVGEETVTSKQKLVDGKPSGDPVVETTIVTQKEDAVIRVGTKTEGTNTVEHTEPVPYETQVEYDPEMPAGTYEVVTPGKAGEKTVKVTQTIVNSKVTDTQREESVTTEPTTEVIKVGTKQATATDKVEWKEPIPFSTVVRPNPDLKPGEVVTVQEGVNGEATYTATFEGTNGQAKVTESKDRTEPTDKIVEYGPTIADKTLTTTTTNPVPFNTTFVADPTLPVGEQVVDKQGENGVDTVTATQEIKDGKPVGEPTITTKRTKEPVNAVVRVGTKTEGQTVNTYETAIPFPVRVVYDPSLAPGESKVTQEGKPGTKKVTITQPVVNSAPNGEATVAEETVTEPTEQIVTVGTKPDEATNTATWTVDVPFKTVVRANPELKPGEVKTVQEGEYGEKKFTADFSSVGSDSKVDTKEEQTKESKDQIIEYGPTIDDQTLKSETTRPIEFKTEYVLDESLPAGEQKVDQQGENGEEKITSTQEIKDGKPVGEPKITTEVTKPAKNATIRVGTKPATKTATTTATATTTEKSTTTETTSVDVPTTITTQVPTTVKETQTSRVEVPTTITTTLTTTETVPTTVSGKPTTSTTTKEVPTTITTTVPTAVPTTVEATKLSTVTAAPVTTTVTEKPKPVSETVKLPYTTKIVYDPTLAPGTEVEDIKGVDGEVKVTFANGKATAETVKEPVQRVVRVGTRPADGVEYTEETPYSVKVVEDPTLDAGKYAVEQEGVPGRKVHHANGDVTETPAKDHIIKVGTKSAPAVEGSTEVDTPFPVRFVYDPNLAPGESRVTQKGEPGRKKITVSQKVVNGQPVDEVTVTETTVKEPVEQIITVGIEPYEAKNVAEWVAPLPYDTIVRPNNALKPGEIKTVQKGEYGEKKFTADFTATGTYTSVNTKEEVTKQPVQQIIEYGPTIADETLKSVTNRLVDYPTEFVFDDTLEQGTQKVDQQGANGIETITSTQEIKGGKPVGEPKITVDRILEPQKAIIRIGTKPTTVTTTTTAHATTERVTETQTTTVTVPKIVETTTVTEPTTVTQAETTVTKPVPTTVTTQVPSPVVVTTTQQGTPTTYTTTETVPTTITTSVAQVTVTKNVTTTEKSTATETTTATTTVVNEEAPEVRVNGSTIEYWQTKGESIAIAIRDENVKGDTLKFRPIDGGQLSADGRKLTLPGTGVYTVDKKGTVTFAPEHEFSGNVPPVEIEYARTDGAKVVTPITVIGHYNDCGCKTPKPSTPESSTPESSTPQTSVTQPSEPSPTTTNPAEPSSPQSSSNPEPSQPSNPVNPSQPGESSTPKAPTTSKQSGKPSTPASTTVTTTINNQVITTVVPVKPTTSGTTTSGTSTPQSTTKASETAKPTTSGLTTVDKPTATSAQRPDAQVTIDRCVANAVRSPLLYLIPVSVLAYTMGPAIQPVVDQVTGPYQRQLNQINNDLNRQFNQFARDTFGEDPLGLNSLNNEVNRRVWENQDFARLANQVNEANAQAQALAAQYQPQLELAGKAVGTVLAVAAAGAVMYDWCSNEPGQAWTAIGTDQWSNLANRNQGQ